LSTSKGSLTIDIQANEGVAGPFTTFTGSRPPPGGWLVQALNGLFSPGWTVQHRRSEPHDRMRWLLRPQLVWRQATLRGREKSIPPAQEPGWLRVEHAGTAAARTATVSVKANR
jgi:hypothetical protein